MQIFAWLPGGKGYFRHSHNVFSCVHTLVPARAVWIYVPTLADASSMEHEDIQTFQDLRQSVMHELLVIHMYGGRIVSP